jgi:hypothetical protein
VDAHKFCYSVVEYSSTVRYTTMAVPKRRQWRSIWYLTQFIGALAVLFYSVALIKLSTVSKCDQDVNMMVIHPNEFNGQNTKTRTLSSRQSYGFFDDISDDSWKLQQERARASRMYANPENPEEYYQYPIYWYTQNLQVRERLRRSPCEIILARPSGSVPLTLLASVPLCFSLVLV